MSFECDLSIPFLWKKQKCECYFRNDFHCFVFTPFIGSIQLYRKIMWHVTYSTHIIMTQTLHFLCIWKQKLKVFSTSFVCENWNNWYKKFSNSNIKGNLLDFLDKLELFTNSCFLQIFHWHFLEPRRIFSTFSQKHWGMEKETLNNV